MNYKVHSAKCWVDSDYKKELELIGFTFSHGLINWHIESNGSIDINSLDELNNFIDKFEEIILTKDSITIYNGYIE